jgi:hypothetical protein
MQPNRRLFLLAPMLTLPAVAGIADAAEDLGDAAAAIARQLQELNDAVTYGRAEVWSRYLHENAVLTDEEGHIATKAELVAQIAPLPQGVSGSLTTQSFSARRTGNVVICTYVQDEHETYHGAQLHCQYLNTAAWVSTADGWRLLANQTTALRGDPPEMTLSAAQQQDYVGVYRLSADVAYAITRSEAGLSGRQSGGRERPLKAEVPDLLFSPGRPRYRYVFVRDAQGRIERMIERREQWDMVWIRET